MGSDQKKVFLFFKRHFDITVCHSSETAIFIGEKDLVEIENIILVQPSDIKCLVQEENNGSLFKVTCKPFDFIDNYQSSQSTHIHR